MNSSHSYDEVLSDRSVFVEPISQINMKKPDRQHQYKFMPKLSSILPSCQSLQEMVNPSQPNDLMRVLIVDDTPYNIEGLKLLLRQFKFIQLVDVAYNGQESVDKFQ